MKLDKLKVVKALEELETVRNEKWHVRFIERRLQEFENMNWDTYLCVERINNAKYKKQFVEDDDLIINNSLVKLKAEILLEKNNYVNVATYNKLINYYEEIKNPPNVSMSDEGAKKLLYELKIKNL